jgi:hypothetical protein
MLAALAVGACSDSTAPQRPLTPEELESFGEAIAGEVELGLSSLVANDLLGAAGVGGGVVAGRPRFDRFELADVNRPECSTTPQDPILDDDSDNIPNDVVFSFARPACDFVFGDLTIALTGSIRLVDALPSTAGFGYNATLNDFAVSIIDPEFGTITAGRDGTMGVAVTPNLLTLTQTMQLSVTAPETPATSVTSLISATFAPAQGTSLVAGQPLPSGTYTPSSTVTINQAGQNVVFTLSAPTPLQYDAGCAAGDDLSAFAAGEVRATISGPHGNGYVRMRWIECGLPEVVFVAVPVGSQS